jgi:hypothetical protein
MLPRLQWDTTIGWQSPNPTFTAARFAKFKHAENDLAVDD